MKERAAPRRNLILAAASISRRVGCTASEGLQRQLYGLLNGPESGQRAWRAEIEYASYLTGVHIGQEEYMLDSSGEYLRDEKGYRILHTPVRVDFVRTYVDSWDRPMERFLREVRKINKSTSPDVYQTPTG